MCFNPMLSVVIFIRCSDMKFVLLHDGKNDDSGIKSFFTELWELYVKVS